MGVVEDRFGEAARRPARRLRVRIGDESLATVPAVVGADATDGPGGGTGREVDLLARFLADVANHHVAVDPVEGEAPRVAQAVGPDLVATRTRGEGIPRRDRVGGRLAGVGVDAEDL